MGRSRSCIALLLGAHTMLGVLLAVFGNSGFMWPSREIFKGVVVGVFLGQVVSAALWSGLANGPLWRRLGGGLLADGMIYSLAVTSFQGWTNGGARIAMLLWLVVPWAAVVMAAATLRRFGIRCTSVEAQYFEAQSEGIQFSLRQMAIVIAICATLLGLVRGMKSQSLGLTVTSFLLIGSVFAIVFVLQMLVCLWAALGVAPWARRIWAPWLLAFAWWPLMAYASGGAGSDFLGIGILAVTCVSLALESLLAVRLAGYRLVRDGSTHPTALSSLETTSP